MYAGVAPYTSHSKAREGRQVEIYKQIISQQAHLPRLLLLGDGGVSHQAAEQVLGEQAVGRGFFQGSLLVKGDSLEYGDDEKDVTSLCTWGQESGLDQGRQSTR